MSQYFLGFCKKSDEWVARQRLHVVQLVTYQKTRRRILFVFLRISSLNRQTIKLIALRNNGLVFLSIYQIMATPCFNFDKRVWLLVKGDLFGLS